MNALTPKETSLLNDAKSHEQICIEKYSKYSMQATDTNLKTLFQGLSQKEQQHFDSINQILNGTIPNVSTTAQSQQPSQQQQASNQSNVDKNNDSYLCKDALSTEKHVSSMYNTAIFEFKDVGIRNVLNHIQKEEQEHGEQIYNYMAQNNMYN